MTKALVVLMTAVSSNHKVLVVFHQQVLEQLSYGPELNQVRCHNYSACAILDYIFVIAFDRSLSHCESLPSSTHGLALTKCTKI